MGKKKIEIWEAKPKAGHKRIYNDPNDLWLDALEYFHYTAQRTFSRQEFVGKDGIEAMRHTPVPFSMESFYVFVGISKPTWREYRERYKTTEGKSSDECENDIIFSYVCTRIEKVIFAQQYEGAATGNYNANIVARKLGLTDKKDITSDGKVLNTLAGVKIELPEGISFAGGYKGIEDAEVVNESPLKKVV